MIRAHPPKTLLTQVDAARQKAGTVMSAAATVKGAAARSKYAEVEDLAGK